MQNSYASLDDANQDIDTFENKDDIKKNRATMIFEVPKIKHNKIQLNAFSKEISTLAFIITLKEKTKK